MKKLTIQILLLTVSFMAVGQVGHFEKLKRLINLNQCDKALELIDSMIAEKQATNIVYYYKASCEREEKLFESSIMSATAALKTTIESDSLYPRILLERSLSYAFAGKLDSGIADNETLLKMFPNDVGYLLNMSFLYGENQQLDDCIKTLRRALAIDSLDVEIIVNLVYYSNETRDYKTTIEYATKGLTITKDSVWISSLLNSLGFAQSETLSLEAGLKTVEQAVAFRPSNPYAYFNLGRIYLKKKNVDEACKNFKIAKQLGAINLTTEYLERYCN